MQPFLHLMALSAMVKASGPLILITEIAPVPGTVAGAHIVSSLSIHVSCIVSAKLLIGVWRLSLLVSVI